MEVELLTVAYTVEGCHSYSRLMHGEKRRRWLVCGGGGGGTALSESCNKMNNE